MKNSEHISKFLSLVLRHKPEDIGLTMDLNGWVTIENLLFNGAKHNFNLDIETLENVVYTNDKKRFSFNIDHTAIRANQGHSVPIDLELTALKPLDILYHGTVEKYIELILSNGLQKMKRHHVHLSKDIDTALNVGSRRGQPIILKINATKMYEDGFPFYLSQNGVWLVDEVPAQYIEQ